MPSNLIVRPNGRVGARVTVAGTTLWLGTYGSEELAAEAVRRAKGGWRPDTTTVEDWADQVWELFPGSRSAETTAHYRQMVAPFVRVCGRRGLADIDAVLAQGWASRWPGHVPYLRRMFGKAVKVGLLEANPWAGVEVASGSEPRVPPTDAQLRHVQAACERRGGWWLEFGRLVDTAAFSGARLSGLAGLQVGDVDLDARRMVVTEKGARTRTIVVLEPAVPVLAVQMRDRVGRVFSSAQGRPLDRRSVSRAWRTVADEAGFSGSFHALKHYAATWLQERGVEDRDIAVQLGHTDRRGQPYTDLIERVYGHVDPSLALGRVDALASGGSAALGGRIQEGSPDGDAGVARAH